MTQSGERRFEVAKLSLFGNPNVGVYMHVTDEVAFVPSGLTKEERNLIEEVLGVEVVELTIAGSRLLGIMLAGNNNGIIVSRAVEPEELEVIKRAARDMNIVVLESRNNAVGNLIVANDRAALLYPYMEDSAVKEIEDALGVEARRGTVAGVPTVGSVLVVTNRGGLAHPDATDEEVEALSKLFGVPVSTGTVNFGVSFVRTGLVANSKGAIAGEDTTGPELARIQVALGGGVP
ncbi:MAG: translation initiation factor IF-6 [Desulfurococcales archaeon]|nr:translation initiation factor IF-6 [Desulfurococcales archaeon]